MFSFAFDIEDPDLDETLSPPSAELEQLSLSTEAAEASTSALPHAEVPLSTLLATLPPLISYTPVIVLLTSPTAKKPSTTLLRRDLFDARFQVLSQDEEDGAEVEGVAGKGKEKQRFVDENTDLVKGVYEGGLKTWECSLDLVDCLDGLGFGAESADQKEVIRGKSVLEIGCGTALPSCSVFARLLAEIRRRPTEEDAPRPPVTRIHLQDYNKQVLSLITLPNILLTFAADLAFHSFSTNSPAPDADEDPSPAPFTAEESSAPGELELTPEYLSYFDKLLERENIDLKFFEGDWSGMVDPVRQGEKYDLVLTSETVYEVPSLPSLLDLLQAASGEQSKCLVACKKLYFGVGGGELEFRRRVEDERQGKVETVWGMRCMKGRIEGVGRVVMSVEWPKKDD